LNVLAFSTYNFHLLQSWMQLVQFFIFNFFISFIISSFHLFFGLPSGCINIGFHLCTLFTILSSGIRYKWPNQLNLWTFITEKLLTQISKATVSFNPERKATLLPKQPQRK
jgi:hypothetical protein